MITFLADTDKPWEEWETDWLIELCGHHIPDSKIASLLGRTVRSVIYRRQYLHIAKHPKPFKTPDEKMAAFIAICGRDFSGTKPARKQSG